MIPSNLIMVHIWEPSMMGSAFLIANNCRESVTTTWQQILCHSYRENSPAWCCVFVCTRHELVLMSVFQVLTCQTKRQRRLLEKRLRHPLPQSTCDISTNSLASYTAQSSNLFPANPSSGLYRQTPIVLFAFRVPRICGSSP
jgi:hypothetical protein